MNKLYIHIFCLLSPFILLSQSDQKTISDHFLFSPDQKLEKVRTIDLKNGIIVDRYKKHINGIKVEHGDYILVKQNTKTIKILGEHKAIDDAQKSSHISEEKALAHALKQLEGELYSWEATTQLLELTDLNHSQRKKLLEVCDSENPKGELVYVEDYYDPTIKKLQLAYKFIIESVEPVFKDKVYVSALDGRLLLRDPIIKHGVGTTRYSGERTFPTTQVNIAGQDTFELVGPDPITGVVCETRSVNGLGGLPLSIAAVYALSIPIQDGDADDPCSTDGDHTVAEQGDDIWAQNEHKKAIFGTVNPPEVSCCVGYTANPGNCNEIQNDDVALDAQWGAQMVAQYWMSRHGRLSYDDLGAPIRSFVHYGDAYNNAFWNGSFMTYGDGTAQQGAPNPNGNFAPFTSLDICAHEIGHAICSNTSNLVYQKEAGAMNESFSDIWGAAIERYVLDSLTDTLPYDPYAIGEQVDETDGGLMPGDPNAKAIRWMDDPNVASNPDTYQGTYYYPTEGFLCTQPNLSNDYCGVHLNSGVINKWFYLLSAGSGLPLSPGSGLNGLKATMEDEMNDLGNTYSITGIGFEKAEKIAFFAEVLLTPNAIFQDMREASILGAQTLYGICSNEEIQVTNAWYAVGVGDEFESCTPRIKFSDFNPMATSEKSSMIGCQAQKQVSFSISSYQANETIHFQTIGNAILGTDFILDTSSLTFIGDEIKTFTISIIDDKVVEANTDTIILFFNDGGYSDTMQFLILDDDILPFIGDTVQLLNELFDTSTIPNNWNVLAVNVESQNDWFFNGTAQAAGKAFVSIPGSTEPAYNLAAFSHIRLVSPLLDSRGRSDVEVSFDWGAGGEADAVETTVVFDYGSFQISFDGQKWINIENFVGTNGGQTTAFGQYNMHLSELSNRQFYLGFQWYNDALIGSNYSFTIDNVKVIAQDMDISQIEGASMAANVLLDEKIAFISADDELIGLVHSINQDLGCSEMNILETQMNSIVDGAECDNRSSKVFGFTSANSIDQNITTIFFTEAEVLGWSQPAELNILTVKGSDIDNLQDGFTIIEQPNIVVVDSLQSDNPYISYSFELPSDRNSICLTDRAEGTISRIVTNISDASMFSLRERVASACPGDTILFDPILSGDTIILTGSEIILDKDLYIFGSGIQETFISGGKNSKIFVTSNDAIIRLINCSLLK